MILTAKDVLVRAWQRGHVPASVAACLQSTVGEMYDVDVDHPAYPKAAVGPPLTKTLREYLERSESELGIPLRSSAATVPTAGPGTELKKLLKLVGITATPNCSCNARAREMDARGPEWCEGNLDTIVGWLREEATKRKLPFIDMAGRLLVKRAIRNARRAAKN